MAKTPLRPSDGPRSTTVDPDRRDDPLMESPTGIVPDRDERDRIPGTLADDDDLRKPVSGAPVGRRPVPDDGYEETEDGLSDLEETVRQQAEDRASGGRGDDEP